MLTIELDAETYRRMERLVYAAHRGPDDTRETVEQAIEGILFATVRTDAFAATAGFLEGTVTEETLREDTVSNQVDLVDTLVELRRPPRLPSTTQ